MLFSGDRPSEERLLLVVDVGNTTASFALFRGTALLEEHRVRSATLFEPEAFAQQVGPILRNHTALRDAALCSVVPSLEHLLSAYLRSQLSGEIFMVSSSVSLPFELHYDVPESFGADRIALCAFGSILYPDEAVIALDIGTAITVDVLTSGREYLGGLIMPGLELMTKALHDHTARLPLVDIHRPETLLGRSTADAIRSGVVWGCVSSLEGVVARISADLCDERHEASVRVIATGGNAPLISDMFTSPPEVVPDAVLQGTHYLFKLNARAGQRKIPAHRRSL